MSEYEIEVVSRSTKILAISRALLVSLLVTVVLLSVASIFTIFESIKKANAELLDCIAPYGICYTSKAADLESNNIVHINAVAAYCTEATNAKSVKEIEDCMIKELAK